MKNERFLKTLEQTERFTLTNRAGLRIDLYPNGALCAVRHENTLINQMIGVAPEGAPFRLWLRNGSDGISLVGPATAEQFDVSDERHATWQGRWRDVAWGVQLALNEKDTAWTWRVTLRNEAGDSRSVDAILAQDLGLASTQGARSNEAYTSHYIDHTVVTQPQWGPVVLSRQNLIQEGAYPWIAHACVTGATAFATDGIDVFGLDQRVRGVPRSLTRDRLPSLRRQGESACAALQSRTLELEPGTSDDLIFVARYLPDHPDVSADKDTALFPAPEPYQPVDVRRTPSASMWDAPVLRHGEEPDDTLWARLYPERRHEEWNGDMLWSFFTEDGRHVVSAAKEAEQERAHGHVLCASEGLLPDTAALGTTVYAPGVFNAQVYLENPNTARLLTVVRDPFQRLRGPGQRIWIDAGAGWELLGSPSIFEMGEQHASWHYVWGDRHLEVQSRVVTGPAAVVLTARTVKGPPVRWRVTHQLALDANELDSPGSVIINESDGAIHLAPAPDTLAAQRCPDLRFLIQVAPLNAIARIGGDEMIWSDGEARGAPYVVLETEPARGIELRIDAFQQQEAPPRPASVAGRTWRMTGDHEEITTLADILPWFRHDAWIHLASPHGLEQYGGAAWGVRDVCQGPIEWLITEQRYEEIRTILRTVFSHQYEEDGLWPQWFMLGRYADLQQRHCHGDIMFWPLKALCDYAEAANDPGILDMETPFINAETLRTSDRAAPLSAHVKRVIQAYHEHCIPGTALVAYGDGDWDDTLQPVQPDMRRHMVSAWTVQLAYHVFTQLAELYRRANREREAEPLTGLCARIRADFMKHLMPDGIVAGFAVFHDGYAEPLIHPRDRTSGIQYRLLPMTRGILSGLFDEQQIHVHRDIIREHLRFPDGVRLMNRPVTYTGGASHLFQRAETSAYFGREVSLQYVHAHLRYAEAMARVGDAEEAWWALQIVNPLGLTERLPHALPRQANVYFSSSDGDFPDRYEAGRRFDDLRSGHVGVKGGWRLYSSGPGLFLHKVRCGLLGIREYYDEIHFDPVLPATADGLTLTMNHEGADTTIRFARADKPGLRINGNDMASLAGTSSAYRARGMILDRAHYRCALNKGNNVMQIHAPSMSDAVGKERPSYSGATQ